ncbi:MAG: metallophosphoesterase [Acidobacteria bacterium]|nr:metallophosphoesterase [Acidobacteriota bacterium]
MIKRYALAMLVGVVFATAMTASVGAQQQQETWRFAVSGDSRNCGSVVMSGIASSARANNAAFYWHLGDLRYAQDFDEDMQRLSTLKNRTMSIVEYMRFAWPDFIEHQIKPFGDMPYYVTLGNHDVVFPRTRQDFIQQFADWLVTPALRDQRLKDDPDNRLIQTYYRWIQNGVSFYSLDNASPDMFDRGQMSWFNRTLAKDVADPSVRSIVVGMHAALPGSLAGSHSMESSVTGVETGRAVYKSLLDAQSKGKKVYVIQSHLHSYIAGAFNTDYWKANGGVLPGWVIGTAGAYMSHLPAGAAANATEAKEFTYGSLLATVRPDGEISFEFKPIAQTDVPADVAAKYGQDFVRYCFEENREK